MSTVLAVACKIYHKSIFFQSALQIRGCLSFVFDDQDFHGQPQLQCIGSALDYRRASTALVDRYYRVDRARSSSGENAGLGLAVVKTIVACQVAHVEVKSELGPRY